MQLLIGPRKTALRELFELFEFQFLLFSPRSSGLISCWIIVVVFARYDIVQQLYRKECHSFHKDSSSITLDSSKRRDIPWTSMTIARKPGTNKREVGGVLFVTSRRLHWRDSRQDPRHLTSSSHPPSSVFFLLLLVFFSPSPSLSRWSSIQWTVLQGLTAVLTQNAATWRASGSSMTDGDSSPCPLDRIVASNCFGGARDTVHWPTQIWSLSSLEGPTWTWTGYLRFQACEPLFPRDDHEVSRFRPLVYTISR